MENNKNKIEKPNSATEVILGILTFVFIYTLFGLGAGILYSLLNNTAKELYLPHVSIYTVLLVWYIWAFVWMPPIFIVLSAFNKNQFNDENNIKNKG